MRKSTEKEVSKKPVAKAAKPRAKRTTVAELRKENDALKATNMKLLNEVGNLSAMYMNTLGDKERSERAFVSKKVSDEKEAIIMATKRIIGFLMQTYGFDFSALTR